ncbi:MAG: hypothetical protein AAF740_11490 [Bacteroidota bacterium]
MKRAFWFLVLVCLSYLFWNNRSFMRKPLVDAFLVERVRQNYGDEVDAICKEKGVPSEYFKALIILEVSARKDPPSRTEKSVWEKLRATKEGKRKRYGFFTANDLQSYDDTDLKFMATSWGPFQIMGFHAVKKGFPVRHLRDENALRTGIEWCLDSYGAYIKKGDYKNAFHIHNTGSPIPFSGIPFTTDPDYVAKGVAYMELLEKPQILQSDARN